MSIIDRVIGRYVQKALADRAVGSDVYEALMRYVGKGQPAYMADNVESYISNGYLYNPTVYSIVSFIAQKAGAVPWVPYRIKDDTELKRYKSAAGHLSLKSAVTKKKALEEVKDHDISALLKDPNPLQGWAEWMEQVIGFKLVTGETFIHMIGPENGANAGKVQEMWTLPTQVIDIIPGDRTTPVAYYSLKNDPAFRIDPKQIIHLKYWTPEYIGASWLHGLSPIRAARRVVSKSNASYDAGTAAMQNSGMLGFISANKALVDQELTPEQAEALQSRIDRYSKPTNRGKIPVTSYDLKWNQMGMSPVDLAIIEGDRMDLRTLCNIYHVPSELFGDAQNKTYSNTKEAGRAIYSNAVIPALSQFRDAFNQYVQAMYPGIYVDFDLSLIPEMQDDLNEMTTALGGAWWITGNEKRDLMSFGTDESNPMMDDYFVPAGLVPLGMTAVPDDTLIEEEAKRGLSDYKPKPLAK